MEFIARYYLAWVRQQKQEDLERLVPEFDPHTLLAQFAIMRFVHQLIVSVTLAATLAAAFGASITGNVKGPDSKPFMGAFVAAENTLNEMTVTVLTDAKGGYHIKIPIAKRPPSVTLHRRGN